MKKLLKHIAIDTFCLWVTSRIAQGLVFEEGFKTLLITGGALAIVSLLAKPIINVLLLPINLVTFGLFRWVSSAIVLYLVTLLVKNFKVLAFNYQGFSGKWFEIPVLNFHGIWAYVGFSFVLSVMTSFIYWLMK